MKKALVTGGAGFIGSHLVARLARDGWDVAVIDNLSTGFRRRCDAFPDGVRFVEGDITDRSLLRSAMEGAAVVFHQAALGSVPRSVKDPLATHANNATGTLEVLEAARVLGVPRVVWASSSSVYGDTPVLPKVETMETRPLSPYAVSKLTCEHYARVFRRTYGLETFGLRYFNVFGPDQTADSEYAAVIPRFITGALRDEVVTVNGDGGQTRDFTYIDNVIEANLRAAAAPEAGAGEAYNIGCGQRLSLNDLLGEIGRILGRPLRVNHVPTRAGDVRDSMASIDKAAAALGYAPAVAFAEGLRHTVAAYRGVLQEAA